MSVRAHAGSWSDSRPPVQVRAMVAAVAMIASALVLLANPSPASAETVTNPGPVEFTATSGTIHVGANPGFDFVATPSSPIRIAGTVDADGNITIPSGWTTSPTPQGVLFPSTTATLQDSSTVTLTLAEGEGGTGTIDPATGAAELTLQPFLRATSWTGGDLGGGCPASASATTLTLTTANGSAYDPADGTMTIAATPDFGFLNLVGCIPPVPAYVNSILGNNTNGGSASLDLVASPKIVSTVTPVAPFLTDSQFVDRQFNDILGRVPTAGERDQILDQLAAGQTRESIVESLLNLDRATLTNQLLTGGLSGTAEYTMLVILAFEAGVGRPPDPAGLAYWVDAGANDGVDAIRTRRTGTGTDTGTGTGTDTDDLRLLRSTFSVQRVAAGLAKSNEFKRKGGAMTNANFVANLYQTMLHRAPDAAGGQYWRTKLDRGTSRATMIALFATSKEAIRKSGKEIEVLISYQTLLGRIPSVARTTVLADRMEDGTPFTTIIAEILDSPAYEARVS